MSHHMQMAKAKLGTVFTALDGGGFQCLKARHPQYVHTLQSSSISALSNNIPYPTIDADLGDPFEQDRGINCINHEFETGVWLPSNNMKVSETPMFAHNLDASASVPRTPYQPQFNAQTPIFVPRTSSNYSSEIFLPDANIARPICDDIRNGGVAVTLASPLSNSDALNFTAQDWSMSVLNPEAAVFTPSRGEFSSRSPGSVYFIPGATADLFVAPTGSASAFNPETEAFQPLQVASASFSPQAVNFVPARSKESGLDPKATSFTPSAAFYHNFSKLSRQELLHPPSSQYILQQTPWPISIGVPGVPQAFFDERYCDLVATETVEIEFHGLGLNSEPLPEVIDEDFDDIAKLDAALTRPSPVSVTIPDYSISPSGLVIMPPLYESTDVFAPIYPDFANKTEDLYDDDGCLQPPQAFSKRIDFIRCKQEVLTLPKEPSPDDFGYLWNSAQYQMAKSCLPRSRGRKSPLSQCQNINYEADESLKNLRGLESLVNWADDVDGDETILLSPRELELDVEAPDIDDPLHDAHFGVQKVHNCAEETKILGVDAPIPCEVLPQQSIAEPQLSSTQLPEIDVEQLRGVEVRILPLQLCQNIPSEDTTSDNGSQEDYVQHVDTAVTYCEPRLDYLTGMLEHVVPINDTTRTVVASCLIQPLAGTKKPSLAYCKSPPSSVTSETGSAVIDDMSLNSSFSGTESLFEDDDEAHAEGFDVDANPEARLSTSAPSSSSSQGQPELVTEEDESSLPLSDQQPKECSVTSSAACGEDTLATSPPQLMGPLPHPHVDVMETETSPAVAAPALNLAFRPVPLQKFGKSRPAQVGATIQSSLKPDQPVFNVDQSLKELPRSRSIANLHALDERLNGHSANARKPTSPVTKKVSKKIKHLDKNLGEKRRTAHTKNQVTACRKSHVGKLDLIGEDKENIPEDAFFNLPEKSINELADLGCNANSSTIEVNKDRSELSYMDNEILLSPRKSYIPVPLSPTRPVTPLSRMQFVPEEREDHDSTSSPVSERGSPIERPESNTPTRMSKRYDQLQLNLFEDSESEAAKSESGLSTILEESYADDDSTFSASTYTPAAVQNAVLGSLSPALSTPGTDFHNDEEKDTGKLLPIPSQQLPLTASKNVHKDRISSGSWLSGNSVNINSEAEPLDDVTEPNANLPASPLNMPTRASPLSSAWSVSPSKPIPAMLTTTNVIGLRATTPPSPSSSVMRQFLAGYATDQRPSFEFFSSAHPAATQNFGKETVMPTGCVTGLRDAGSVRKAWDDTYVAAGRERSGAGSAQLQSTSCVTLLESEADITPPPAAKDVPFILSRASQQRSRVSSWISGGTGRKLQKRNRDVSGQITHPFHVDAPVQDVEGAMAKPKKEKESFLGKVKKMCGIGMGSKKA